MTICRNIANIARDLQMEMDLPGSSLDMRCTFPVHIAIMHAIYIRPRRGNRCPEF